MVMVKGSSLSWSRASGVPNTLRRWYRRLSVAAGRNPRSATTPAPGSRPVPLRALDEATVPHTRSTSLGSVGRQESTAILAEELEDGIGGEHVVNAWRAEQLRLLGLSPILAEAFAGLVDWHQIANLVERGCSAQLALEIVR
jgi:hypothetical protein